MDVKDLDKSQLILLTILVSFVISIATSVVIVSLIQEAPQEIVRPINKVIKETVEKVVRVESKNSGLTEEEVRALVGQILLEKEAPVGTEGAPTEGAETPPDETAPAGGNDSGVPPESQTEEAPETEPVQ